MFQPLCHREAISHAKGQRHAAEGEPYSPVVTDSEYAYRKGYDSGSRFPSRRLEMQGKTITVSRGPWRFKWSGGRLADVYHASKPEALDCVQVGEYDWEKGEGSATRADLNAAADEWMRESAADYTNELPYL